MEIIVPLSETFCSTWWKQKFHIEKTKVSPSRNRSFVSIKQKFRAEKTTVSFARNSLIIRNLRRKQAAGSIKTPGSHRNFHYPKVN
ncbi:hypothetical protein BACCOPRO_03321 [Phocaeicola coprophilus DSM 18228 = JCM 13818]|uniref:Uncharacterized protein n=1 Tax=Phocaeicola coprophilus DSM 18228 = JCM 13818 TaxID=547042 RepID=S0FBF6_9BACT|nr:hypothetical protein BACCOPRO_03321 [Phocaeicola coprophilus DSM 18228 = JCM 13818]